jgi:hypothetical protein
MADLLNDFLVRLQQHVPDLTERVSPDVLLKVESEMRHVRKGDWAYVGQKVSRFTRISMVARGLQQKLPLNENFANAGISRATGYRYLSSK